MKKILLLLTLLCTMFSTAMATEVTIGDPTSTTTNTYLPWYSFYKYGLTQQIYTADEISNAGGSAGSINSITLYLKGNLAKTFAIEIYVVETTKSAFASATDWETLSASDMVYSTTSFTSTSADVTPVTFTFDSPFTYSGGNLLVGVRNQTGDYASGLNGVVISDATNQALRIYRDGSEYDLANPGSGTLMSVKNVITLDMTAGGGGPTCDRPTDLDITGITAHEATLTWAGGGSSVYNVEYKKSSADKWTLAAEATSLTTLQLQNLESNTAYNVRVNCVCGEELSSSYISANFKTIIGIPYGVDFDELSAIPSEWTKHTGLLTVSGSTGTASLSTTSSGWNFQSSTTGVFESKHMYINIYGTSVKYWIVSPEIPIVDGLQLTFIMALSDDLAKYTPITPGRQSDDKFAVLATMDDGTTWSILRMWDNSANAAYPYDSISLYGEEVALDLSAFDGQNVKLAFYGESTVSGGDNYLHIDDILVAPVPSCLKPDGLAEVPGRTTKNTIQVGWNARNGEQNWAIQYKKKSATDWQPAIGVTENPYTITGLDAFTEYSIRVAAFCDPTDSTTLTDFTKPITAKTAAGVPFEQAFSTSALPAEWKRYTGLWEEVENGGALTSVTAGWATASKTAAAANGVFPDSAYHVKLTLSGADVKHWLVSPTISMEAGYQLSFQLALTKSDPTSPTPVTPGAQNDDKFIVAYSEDGGASWTALREWNNSNSQFDAINATANGQLIRIPLDSLVGKNVLLAFYGESTDAQSTASNNIHISGLKIAPIPACESTTALDVTGVTGTTATLQWDNVEGATWQYFYIMKPEEEFVPTDANFTSTTGERSVTLTGLMETTSYTFYLRKQCGSDYSDIRAVDFTTAQTPATIPYSTNFESGNGWALTSCASNGNAWVWGTATSNGGTHAIYVSNDNGTSAAYNKSTASIIYATKIFYFEEPGAYNVSYDWIANGEVSSSGYWYDFLRVALVPESVELTAGTALPTGFTDQALPEGWITLDGGNALAQQTTWQHLNTQAVVSTAGYYKMVFAWKQDGSGGTDPAGCIDNVSISKMDCAAPSGLAISEVAADSAILVWDDLSQGLDTWVYAYAPAMDAKPADSEFAPAAINVVKLTGLAECTSYKFYLCKVCGSDWSDTTVLNFQTPQLPVAVGSSFTEDFESGTGWLFVNGDKENAWVIDTAAHYGANSTKALYISNNGGAAHAYTNNAAAMVYATKAFTFSDASYIFQYDWIANGEGNYDMLRVALVPLSEMLEVSTPSGVASALPSTWIPLDGNVKKNLSTAWATYTTNEIDVVGDYMVVFVWRNDGSTGSQKPAAVDNFSIKRVVCNAPSNFHAVADSTTTNAAFLKWEPQGSEQAWMIRYKKSNAAEWTVAGPFAQDSVWVENLEPASTYEAQVASWCDTTNVETLGDYTGSINFLTECEAITVFPYSEGFDSIAEASTSGHVLPICWDYINTCSNSSYNYYPTVYKGASYANTEANSLKFYSYRYGTSTSYDPQDQYAILPEMEGINGLRIKFNARANSTGTTYDATFFVGVMSDPSDTATFVIVDTVRPTSTTYAPFVIPFTGYNGIGKYIAIKMPKVDNTVGTASGAGYRAFYLDDIVVEEVPNCLEPIDLAVIDSLTTTTSAVLTWTPQGAETEWVIQYKKHAATDWNTYGTIADADTFQIVGLEPASKYDVKVAAKCGATDVSPYSNAVSLITECVAIASFPYSEGFDSIAEASTSGHVLPICWDYINTCSNSSYNYYPTVYKGASYANTEANSLKFYSYRYGTTASYDPQDQYAILPEMEGISGLRMKFNARAYSTGTTYDATFTVGVMTNPADTATFVPVATQEPATTAYEPFEVRFNKYTGAGKYIAIKMKKVDNTVGTASGAGYRGFYLDDIVVEELPDCLEPEGLAVKSIATDGAELIWTAEENGAWKYAVVLASAEEPADDAFVSVDTNYVALDSLQDNTEYTFYLRKNCGTSVSPSISVSFLTKQLPAALPYSNDFESGNDWAFINGELENAWVYGTAAHTGEGTHALYISNNGGTANAYTVSKAAVVYAFRAFNFEEGLYVFSYDWIANGESNYDYLRVALVPDSVELVAGTTLPTGVSTTSLPDNCIPLDGGGKLNLATTWQHVTTAEIPVTAGIYKVVLLWRDDTSGGTNPPAAVDNFSITKVRCTRQSKLAISDLTATSAKLSWTAGDSTQTAWQIIYTADPQFDLAAAEGIDTLDITTNPYVFANLLTDTTYTVYLRANCSDGEDEAYSPWSTITFNTAKACQTPDDIKADSITTSSASISWYTYGQSGFNLRYGKDGVNWTVVENVVTPYVLNDLEATTTYKVQVQAACEAVDSVWSSIYSFKTAYGIPFEEKFNASSIPADWKVYSGLMNKVLADSAELTVSSGYWIFGTNNGVFDSHARRNIYGTSCYQWLATPKVVLTANAQLTFDLALTAYSGTLGAPATTGTDDKFAVLVSADGGEHWSILREWSNAPGAAYVYNNIALTGEEVVLDLSAYNGQAVMVAFYGESTVSNADNNLHIDNVSIDLIPSCLKPTKFNVSDVKAHTAKLSWTAGDSTQTAWQIAYDTLATTKPDSMTIIDVTENPYVLGNLDPSTTYYVYVRANCGDEDGLSKWSDMKSFTTTVACPAPANVKAILTPGNGAIATLCWKSEAESYTVQYSLNSSFADSIETVVTDTFINLSGLLADSTYYARVKADCGTVDSLSVWSSVLTFAPTNRYELTVNEGTTTNQFVPIYGYYADNFSLSQFIIPAEQLEEILWDTINQLTFYASNANVDFGNAQFEVYMAETEETSISALGDWTKMTQVMSAGTLAIVDKKMVVSLSAPYWYQGDNLLIGVKQTVKGSDTRTYWYGVEATGASVGGFQSTGAPSVSQRNFLPKTMFTYVPGQAPACVKPRHMKVVEVTDYEAIIKWDSVAGGAAWQYALVKGDALPVEADFIDHAADTIALSNLDDESDYVFYLRKNCGEDGYSDVVSIAFTTDVHVEEVPFTDDFEGAKSAWKLINGTSTNAWTIGSGANDGKALYISNDGGTTNAYTFTAQTAVYATLLLDIEESGTYSFKYNWKANGEYDEDDQEAYDYLRVALAPADAVIEAALTPVAGLNDSTLPAGWLPLDNGHALQGVTEWQQARAATDLEPGLYKVVVAWVNDDQDGNNTPAAIDNFSVVLRNCHQPTALTASNITPISATLSWSDGDDPQTAWQIAYSMDENFIPDSVAAIDVASNPYELAGLNEEVTYYVSVRVNCGEGDFSPWSTIHTFTTLPRCEVAGEDVLDTICAGETYFWNGKEYTEEGIYTDTLHYAAVGHCDSIVTLVLSFYAPEDTIFVTDTINEDDLPYIYQADYIEGQAYISYPTTTVPGTYMDTALVHGEHCAAALVLTLTVEPRPCHDVTLPAEKVSICQGDSYTWRGKSYEVSGLYYDTVPTLAGCDSIFVLNLSYYAPEDTIFVEETIRVNELPYSYEADYIEGQTPISYAEGTAVGIYNDTALVQGTHCTAVLVHTLTIKEACQTAYAEPEVVISCDGEAYEWHGVVYSASGIYYDTLQTAEGCDSIATLDLTVVPAQDPLAIVIEKDTICPGDSYSWHGEEYTEAGVYVDTLESIYGCDSIVKLELSLYEEEAPIFLSDTIDESDLPYTLEDVAYATDQLPIHFDLGTEPGEYHETALVHGENCIAELNFTLVILKSQDIDNIYGRDGKKVQKVLYNDIMYIVIDDEWYSTAGQKVQDPRK